MRWMYVHVVIRAQIHLRQRPENSGAPARMPCEIQPIADVVSLEPTDPVAEMTRALSGMTRRECEPERLVVPSQPQQIFRSEHASSWYRHTDRGEQRSVGA